MYLEELILVIIFLVIFSLFSYYKHLLDFEGVLVANIVGLAAISYAPNPLISFFAVVVFFIIAEIASNYPKKKHEKRNVFNVVGNSLPALLSIILIVIFPENAVAFELAFFAAVSAALADTLSSEIGYYSKKDPIMITTLKKVPRGTDGGVTLLGEGAALIGGLIIATIYYFTYHNIVLAGLVVIAGLVGTNIDSIFGAIFETRKILNNMQVNLIGSSSGAIFVLVVYFLLV